MHVSNDAGWPWCADLYPELDAGVQLPRHRYRRQHHLIMSHAYIYTVSAQTGQYLTTFKTLQALSINATSQTHTAQNAMNAIDVRRPR
jgi:hypothetical protein